MPERGSAAMKIPRSTTLISSLLLSVCLLILLPGAVKFAATWRDLYFYVGDHRENNLLVQLGLFSLGFQMIGLIVIWTGYIREERWAWFIMLIILLFFVFPPNALTLLVMKMQTPSFEWSDWFRSLHEGLPQVVWMTEGVIDFLVMLVALLLPLKAFFWKSASSKALGESHN